MVSDNGKTRRVATGLQYLEERDISSRAWPDTTKLRQKIVMVDEGHRR
jgi:hypothetical protein